MKGRRKGQGGSALEGGPAGLGAGRRLGRVRKDQGWRFRHLYERKLKFNIQLKRN